METRKIRDTFLEFFARRDHARVPSSSLVPNDPTLLLTNAGMNQFKPYFLGEQSPPYHRAISVQKCLRTPDIDEVGKTARHLTFFEMLGNFSFGDYYKADACPWAWELVTEGFGIDVERLWVTVYQTDDEAADIWRDAVGVRPERIIRRGKKDNFWSMQVAGPCGPCSEIYVDLGDAYGAPSDEGPAGSEDRYLEIWNLVFMQNDCNAAIEPVGELPKKNIDTGAGLERLALVLQEKPSVFETDTLGAMVEQAQSLTGKTYGTDATIDRNLRILADHGRSLTFLIADGVLPSNQERGYVLRRIMRRAVRAARVLGYDKPVLPPLVDSCVGLMGDFFPEISDRHDFINEVAEREEERFSATLRQGLTLLEGEISRTAGTGTLGPGTTTLPADVAFRLHDTFGFPIDLTAEIAAEAGLDVDRNEFDTLMTKQRERARSARKTREGRPDARVLDALLAERGPTEFDGYEHLSANATVVGMSDGAQSLPVASEGDEVDVILDRTVFYAESGGQVGDRGRMKTSAGEGVVIDTRRLVPGLTGHHLKVRAGEIRVGDDVEIEVDAHRRESAARAHTATHILHWVLRDKIGEHATQAGSLVEPGRLRFDFNHFEALGRDRVDDIGGEIQTRVMVDDGVRAFETSYDFAKSIGAMAIFGEKYGDFVRVVEVGDYSKELCGGTHVPHTSQIGVVVVTSEGSVGANLRRIEALVGEEGLAFLKGRAQMLEEAATLLKTNPDDVAAKLERTLETHKEMEARLAAVERDRAESEAAALVSTAVDLDGTRLVAARRDIGVEQLRALAQRLKGQLGSAIIVLGTAANGKANLIGALSKDLVERGLSARELIAPGAQILGGGGGGKPDLAISGGPQADRLDEAIAAVVDAARRQLTS
ncbi:MAG TPA: alanine--tRNA ligase [Actinomycetota bacterium]|nr:alanine--tRNA ligase [Actinomycetota bacterium]